MQQIGMDEQNPSFVNLYVGTRTDDPTIRRMATVPYPYLIFYEATGEELIVHAIRHMARDPSSMPGSA